MEGLDGAAAVEVGDGARDLENPRVGACAQSKAIDREFHQALAGGLDLAMVAQFARAHLRVGEKARVPETLELESARPIDPVADSRRRLARAAVGQLLILNRRHFDMD